MAEVQAPMDKKKLATFSLSLSNGTCHLISSMYVYASYFICACMLRSSVMFNSMQPHGLQPARLLCPWNFQGKNNAVGCHFLLQVIFLTQGSNLIVVSPALAASSLPLCHLGIPLLYTHTHTHTHTHPMIQTFFSH